MKVKQSRKFLSIGLTAFLVLASGGYWYVFVDGTPQFDGPDATAAERSTNLSYTLEHFQSQAMGMTRAYGVILPPGYRQHPHQRYPVIFLLHGGHGQATDWYKKAAALPVIQALYDQRQLPPSLIITPDGNDDRGSSALWDPQYIDGKHGHVLSEIGDELVNEVRRRYRTKTQPQFWAIGGLSSGGWGALNIGLHYPQHFSVLFSHSGYFVDKSGPVNSPMAYVVSMSPMERDRLRIYLDAGKGDRRFLSQSRRFHKRLDRLGIPNAFHEFPGGHGLYGANAGWNYWHRHLADSLLYVGDRFKEADLAQRASK
ncbi:alpha/beta hydrolase [Stenomitos frigidus]|uniref:Esterase n=1 Tax=Stenomitos frigidus ULC18 TaxID=2107698 RepID=A0A2T1E6F2_9CYAN|nr:alpha/beta hydrolase-fold protein [Stenomitos frigidus]PSB28316.1 esterase [Stenomitos frigidus ULC18]